MLALLRQLLAARSPTSRLPLRHGGRETSARSVAIRPAMRPRRPWGVVFLGSLLYQPLLYTLMLLDVVRI